MRSASRVLRLFLFAALVAVAPAAHATADPALVGVPAREAGSLSAASWAPAPDAVVPAHARGVAPHHGAVSAAGGGQATVSTATRSAAHPGAGCGALASVSLGAAAPRGPPFD